MTGGGSGALTGPGHGDPDGSRRGEMNEKRRACAPISIRELLSRSTGQPELGSRRLAAGRPDQGVSHGSAEQAGNPIAGFHRCLGLDREPDRKPNGLPTTTASQSHPASLRLIMPVQTARTVPVQRHEATSRDCLIVKQAHRELVLHFAYPGGIGGTTTGSSCPDHRDPGPSELARLRGEAVRVCRLGRSRSRGGRRPDVRHEEPGRAPGDRLAVLPP